jgi:hypothetical protein
MAEHGTAHYSIQLVTAAASFEPGEAPCYWAIPFIVFWEGEWTKGRCGNGEGQDAGMID